MRVSQTEMPEFETSIPSEFGQEHVALLALSNIRGVGYWTLYHMGRAGVPYSEVLAIEDGEEASTALRRFGGRLESSQQWHEIKDQGLKRALDVIRELVRRNSRLILKSDPEYPARLLDLVDPPQWIFVEGNYEVLNSTCIAAVGTREPTDDGMFLAQFVGANFGVWGVPTVSGLAAGIDQVVHRWSLRMKVPTIAILGTGLALNYPKGSRELRDMIVGAGGAVVTEYLIHDTYSGENFVRRNRLQAALSSVVVPIEWAPKSGTAHTVRFALALRRPVACLRLSSPAGPESVNVPGTHLFDIPGEENEFRHFIASALSKASSTSEPFQRDMFERP
jgi:DNA processing protein